MRRKMTASAVTMGLLTMAAALLWLLTGASPVSAQEADGGLQLSTPPEFQSYLSALQSELDRGGHSFKVKYSPALERPIEQLAGLVPPRDWMASANYSLPAVGSTSLPSSFDWRANGGVTAVKDQGSCGSCWAFGTVAPLESQIKIKCGVEENLSEQYLISCNTYYYSCNGGWFAHDFHTSVAPPGEVPGAVLEAAAPYTATNGTCQGPYEHPYQLTSWSYVAGWSGVPSVPEIKQAIYDYGAVAAAVCVGTRFTSYGSGIFDYNETCSGGVNHAIALVGWVDDLGPDNGYWILKNSWGTSWGEQGYMRIRYGTSNVGYAANYVEYNGCAERPRLDCSTAQALPIGTTLAGSNSGGADNVSTYSCSARDESGPEVVYTINLAAAGDLNVTLSGLTADLDVFILNACDAGACAAWGESSATLVNAQPGTYLVVVDGNGGAVGDFNITATVSQKLPDLTGQWTSITSSSGGKKVSGTLKVSNIGAVNAGAFQVEVWLSNTGTDRAKLLKTYSLTGLAAGKYTNLSLSYNSSTSLAGKYLLAVVDSGAQVAETREDNNQAKGLIVGQVRRTLLLPE